MTNRYWTYRTRILSQSRLSLEEEILNLRSRMEVAAGSENSFTSDMVIQISSMLDHKIIEYMKTKAKK